MLLQARISALTTLAGVTYYTHAFSITQSIECPKPILHLSNGAYKHVYVGFEAPYPSGPRYTIAPSSVSDSNLFRRLYGVRERLRDANSLLKYILTYCSAKQFLRRLQSYDTSRV